MQTNFFITLISIITPVVTIFALSFITSKPLLIFLVILIIHDILLGMVFLYQRTVRGLSYRLNIDQSLLSFMYPRWMLIVYSISKTSNRWIAIALLFYFNWKFGLVFVAWCLVSFALQMVIPVNDEKNLKKIMKIIKSKNCDLPATDKMKLKIEISLLLYKMNPHGEPPSIFDDM